MRKLKTFPALASVRMPKGAAIVAVHPRPQADQAPALLVEYDDQEAATVERQFVVLGSGDAIPGRAGYVSSWRQHPADGPTIVALYERFDADLPDDLPDDQARADYRTLLSEGYAPAPRDPLQCGPPRHSWHAPADLPPGQHSYEAVVAIARLQEHGYGPVVK